MASPSGYIEIDRRFSALHGTVERDDAAASSYLRSAFRSAVGWDELLKKPLVVILGEPGSGKSWEFRHRAATLQNTGRPAFLIELGRLVAGEFATGFSHDDLSRFQKWLRGSETGFFFLDSVDESKIQRTADFYAALDKVLAAIGTGRDRVQVFISSRISEWQPVTDRQGVLSRFRSKNPKETDLVVVEIEPLDRERVRAFAQNKGITNPDTFLAELDSSFAWEFARRPLDVLDLAEFWMANRRLGTLTEIIEFDVTTKLKETADRQNQFPLSEARAREGAEALAVATVLCMRQQFKVPDDSYKAAEALDATACLPDDWKPGEVKAILSRPLFDSATYGQIRFHHRRIAEYLAAAWFRRRMATGCPTHALIQQLFQEVRGTLVPRRSLIPVIAWLCPGTDRWNEEVRARVLETAPAMHLEHGDAQQLSIEFRKALLSAWIERNKDREHVWDQYTPDALRRLGHAELESEVTRLLAPNATKGKVRHLLVHLVRFSRLTGCIPRLLEMLGSSTESDDAKVYAVAAIRDMGTLQSRQQMWDIIREMPTLPRSMCSVAAEALYPNVIGATELAALLEKPCTEKENKSSLGFALKHLLEEELTPALAASLVPQLNRLIQIPPHIFMSKEETRISDQFRFLLEHLPLALVRLLSEPSPSEGLRATVAESLSLLAEADPFLNKPVAHFDSLDECSGPHCRDQKPAILRYSLAGSSDLPARYTSAGVLYPSDWCSRASL